MTADERIFLDDLPQQGPQRVPRWRRAIGNVAVLVTVLVAVLFILGAWNPWDLVVLTYRFGNSMFGLFLVPVLAFVALAVRWPVRNEARQRGRIAARVAAVAFAITGLLAWGIFGQFFTYEVSVLAESADGERQVVEVTNTWDNRSNMRVWAGTGLAARETGVLGRRCGGSVEFRDRDVIAHHTGFGTWTLALDPSTGEPLQILGPRCPDGPIPATLEP